MDKESLGGSLFSYRKIDRRICMKITRFADSHASLFCLTNRSGMEVTVTSIGATLVSIQVPDRSGNLVDVLLGYDSPAGYYANASAHGALVGRYANRIGGAQFELNGKTWQLDVNEGANVLHGGNDKYFHRDWMAEPDEEGNQVSFTLYSPDLDQGMPGNAKIRVTYSLDDDNNLGIVYEAVSDKDTYFNLTNHSYFNLDGHGAGSIYEQELMLDCDRFAAIDSAFIPTGELRDLKGTPMDFTVSKLIGRDIDADYDQIRLGNGYDHNYVINAPGFEKPFAVARSGRTGIVMEVFTDLPGVQFYSGNNMGTDTGTKDGADYVFRGAFCLETQYYPDTPNKPQFPSNLFHAGETFSSKTVYRFYAE